jgi:hypothetical protein
LITMADVSPEIVDTLLTDLGTLIHGVWYLHLTQDPKENKRGID